MSSTITQHTRRKRKEIALYTDGDLPHDRESVNCERARERKYIY